MAQVTCKYHPERPAVWHCEPCHIDFCLACVTSPDREAEPVCPVCGQTLVRLGASNLIKPFWQDIWRFYRYPLAPAPLLFMVALAAFNAVVGWLVPAIEFIVPILLVIVFIKYAYVALEQTAQGHMTPPPVDVDTLTDELELPFKQIFLVFALFTVNMLVYDAGGVLAFAPVLALSVLALPASVMILATEHSFLRALGPVTLWRFTRGIGPPYFILCGFLFLLLAAFATAAEIMMRFAPPVLTTFMISLLAMYFLLIMFHLMGYAIYQYHEDLSYEVSVAAHEQEAAGEAEPANPALAQVEILLSEGRMEEAAEHLARLVEQAPGDLEVRERYHRLLLARGDAAALTGHAGDYLARLLRERRAAQAITAYMDCQRLDPQWRPDDARVRIQLAQLLRHGSHGRVALRLLNHFHRDFPRHPLIPEAYLLAAQIMCENFGEDDKARQILGFLQQHYADSPHMDEVQRYLQVIDKVRQA